MKLLQKYKNNRSMIVTCNVSWCNFLYLYISNVRTYLVTPEKVINCREYDGQMILDVKRVLGMKSLIICPSSCSYWQGKLLQSKILINFVNIMISVTHTTTWTETIGVINPCDFVNIPYHTWQTLISSMKIDNRMLYVCVCEAGLSL